MDLLDFLRGTAEGTVVSWSATEAGSEGDGSGMTSAAEEGAGEAVAGNGERGGTRRETSSCAEISNSSSQVGAEEVTEGKGCKH